MNQKKAKRLRKHILENMESALLILRNEFGERTKEMSARAVYQNMKKMYYEGKIKV
jgi:hypothetical protein